MRETEGNYARRIKKVGRNMNKLDENWAIQMAIDSMTNELEAEGIELGELIIAVKYKDRTITYNGQKEVCK